MTMVVPLAAASIITPMLLLAFTRRPPRDSITSHLNLDASCVSFAEARACRPSLLMISASCCSILVFHLYDTFTPAFDGDVRQLRQVLVGTAHHAQQHRQIHARHSLHMLGMAQLPADIARCGAKNIGQDQHAVARVELPDKCASFDHFLLG